jgi:2-polyprenyl-3-methyl-5-hydroxy-6-metoxy-1,4-benzoquinol methylase
MRLNGFYLIHQGCIVLVIRMTTIDDAKRTRSGDPKFRFGDTVVLSSPEGYYFTDCLDPLEELSPEVDASALTDQQATYIEHQLQSNRDRLGHHLGLVQKYMDPSGIRALDVGCGGGIFLAKLKERGADVIGIEPADARCQFARTRYGLDVVKQSIESDFWQRERAETFDLVTIWDVIDHVNFPHATLAAAVRLLKNGGFLMMETACRDSFYHRTGEVTYSLSGGRFPTFLKAMYSNQPFGRKQIFSTTQMHAMLTDVGIKVRQLTKVHHLAFPYDFYLRKFVRSGLLVRALTPAAAAFFFVFRIRNKMLVVGQKTGDEAPRD